MPFSGCPSIKSVPERMNIGILSAPAPNAARLAVAGSVPERTQAWVDLVVAHRFVQ